MGCARWSGGLALLVEGGDDVSKYSFQRCKEQRSQPKQSGDCRDVSVNLCYDLESLWESWAVGEVQAPKDGSLV